jgi:pyruvate dehydrogenase E1 component alpha subunit
LEVFFMIENFDPLKEQMLRILHPDGRVEEALKPALSDETIFELYRRMFITRWADRKAIMLQRQGRFGTYAPCEGQEAAQVGSAFALGENDWVYPSFRETGVIFTRGGVEAMNALFLYWMGDEAGQRYPGNIFPIAVPVGTHPLHAVGTAWAAKLQGEKICAICYFGDGATSQGDCLEAMNFAGVFQTPTIFFCQNNQYAISVPRKRQTAAPTLAQKGVAFGFSGVQVDGNDLLAVYAATREAREKAISGLGPTFIEAVTYRFGPHTTADDPTKYREQTELESMRQFDPMFRIQKYLQPRGLWSEERENQLRSEADEILNKVIKTAESAPPPALEDIFRYTYAEMTPDLKEELEEYKLFLKEKETQIGKAEHG